MPRSISSEQVQQQINLLKENEAAKTEESSQILRFKKDHFKVGKTKGSWGLRTARVVLGLIPPAKKKIQERIEKQTDAQRKEAVEQLRGYTGSHRHSLRTSLSDRKVAQIPLSGGHSYINPPSVSADSDPKIRMQEVVKSINEGKYNLPEGTLDTETLRDHLETFDKDLLKTAFMVTGHAYGEVKDPGARSLGRAVYFEKKVADALCTFDPATGDRKQLEKELTKNYSARQYRGLKKQVLDELQRQLSQLPNEVTSSPNPKADPADEAYHTVLEASPKIGQEVGRQQIEQMNHQLQEIIYSMDSKADLESLSSRLKQTPELPKNAAAFSYITDRIAELDARQAGRFYRNQLAGQALMGKLDHWASGSEVQNLERIQADKTRVPPGAQPSPAQFLIKQLRYAKDTKHGHFVKATAVKLPETETAPAYRLHANKFRMAPSEPETMMMQAPKHQAMGDFWLAHVLNDTKAVVDLTQTNEIGGKVDVYYPTSFEQPRNYTSTDGRKLTVSLQGKKNVQGDENLELLKYTVTDSSTGQSKTIHRIHFKAWEDMHGVDPAALDNLINVTDRVAGKGLVAVHCSAGIGRTGTFVSARTAKHTLGGAKLSSGQVEEEVTKLAKVGRTNRNPRFIQKDTQFQTLMNYIGNQDRFAHTTAALKPQPAPEPRKTSSSKPLRSSKPKPAASNKPGKVANGQRPAPKPLDASTIFNSFIGGRYEGKQWNVILADIAQLGSREQLDYLQVLGEQYLQENPGSINRDALEYLNQQIEQMKSSTPGMRPDSAVSYVNQSQIDTRSN
ncbi:MAG: protein-tyrosine phosphatase family protein [Endozoicomonas sp.]